MPSTEVTIRRASCRVARTQPAHVREAIERIDAPTGLREEAILVVRHLTVTLSTGSPRRLDVDLRTVAAGAHRIRTGPAPLDCGAVVFDDAAALILALAVDQRADRLGAWWWRAVLGRRAVAPGDLAVTLLFRHAHAVPAAAMRSAEAVDRLLAHFDRPSQDRLLAVAATVHGAPLLAAVAASSASSTESVRTSAPSHRPGDISAPPATGATTIAGDGTAGPPGEGERARPSRATAVGAALRMLHADPVRARSARYAADVLAALMPGSAGVDARAPSPPTSTSPPDGARSGEVRAPSLRSWTAASTAPAVRDDGSVSPSSPQGDETGGAGTSGPPATIATALGGAFYLLALLDQLDLPASASGAGEPGSRLSRWSVLAMVMRCWRGHGDPTVDDPLHDLLDQLAGPTLATTDGRRERWAFRAPPPASTWLHQAGSGEEDWWWRSEPGGRRRLVSARLGVTIADVPDGERATPPPASEDGDLRWAVHVAALLEFRLDQLGLGRSIVDVPAVVELGDLVVRARFDIEDIDLGVRLAGLDRDPGWCPALGRHVELVFA